MVPHLHYKVLIVWVFAKINKYSILSFFLRHESVQHPDLQIPTSPQHEVPVNEEPSEWFYFQQDWHSRQSIWAVWSTLEYIAVYFCTSVHSHKIHLQFIGVHFEINLGAERTSTSQKRPIQFRVGLPQPAYALIYYFDPSDLSRT